MNHWAQEPITTADVELVITSDKLEPVVKALEAAGFQAERFEWSVNLKRQSGVSVQVSTEAVYQSFPARSVPADVHGILMRVARLEDTLQGKLLAWRDARRRPSKRQKDWLDITPAGGGASPTPSALAGGCGATVATASRITNRAPSSILNDKIELAAGRC